jgi:hypothetical protein
MTTAPKTTAQAGTMIATLQIKREGLVETIDGFAERRREFAVAAELGDDDAAAELQKIEAEEAGARSSLQTLDFALHEVALLRDKLAAQEANKLDIRNAIELDEAISGLLELDDQCDDALDAARALLIRRDAFKAANAATLRRIPRKRLGSMIGRENEVTASLQAYFSEYLNAGKSYGSIRVVDGDAKYYGRQSPRQQERGPRTLTPFEKAMQREINSRSAPPVEVAAIPRQVARRR